MKEIIAIIRPKKMAATKAALEELGFPCFTAFAVTGRGKQRGIASEVTCELPAEVQGQGRARGMKYIPKRMLSVVVGDADVQPVVQAIMLTNRTHQIGDGRVFVCPIDDAARVRTKETGEHAIL